MQEQALQAALSRLPVCALVAVAFVAKNREPDARQVHADLVGAACFRYALQQAELAESPGQSHSRPGFLAAVADDHMPLAALAMLNEQRGVDHLFAQLPVADHEREVVLLDLTLAKPAVQLAQRAAPLGEDEATGGLAIQAVHQR